ncbi:MAG: tRNA pseudouridine(38-40) synthase TruA [Acutalibacteraceae bacterium]|jgi:tRNA pseudouridine38-40 synthase
MPHWQLWIRYDGSRYHGWQVQPNGVTVQQTLQDAVERLTGTRSGITGCSRTDAGVHAKQFCCALHTGCAIPTDRVPDALNAHLPRDIAVMACRAVGEDFHPRYDAVGKRYVYRILNAPTRDPFLEGRAYHIRRRLNVDVMAKAAADLTGKHDFAAFCAAGSTVEDTVRTVRDCGVTRRGELVEIHMQADGFLYNMVRIAVGTLLEIESGRLPGNAVPAILASGDRALAGATAPAEGLYLERVFYPDGSGLNLETE